MKAIGVNRFIVDLAFAGIELSFAGNFDGFVRITEEEEEDDDDDSNDDIVVDHGRRLDALLPTIFASSHAPFLFESFVGDLFLAWFSGEYEGASRCAIVVSRFDFVANQWGVPAVASVETGKSNQNPVLFQRTSERARLYLLHPSQDASVGFRESQATAEVRLLYSDDRGETWSVPSVIFPRGRGSFVRGGILAAKDDAEAMLLPMYFTPAGEFNHAAQYSCVVRSRDGIHWTNEARIPGSEGARGVQPQLVRLSDGKLVVFMRNRVGNRILRSGKSCCFNWVVFDFLVEESIDDGATFTQCTNTELPSNDSGIAALVVDNDLLLLCFNNVHSGRYPLTIALSRDGGLSFLHARDIRLLEIIFGLYLN